MKKILLTKLVNDDVDISIFYLWIMFISVYTILSFVGIIEGSSKTDVDCELVFMTTNSIFAKLVMYPKRSSVLGPSSHHIFPGLYWVWQFNLMEKVF